MKKVVVPKIGKGTHLGKNVVTKKSSHIIRKIGAALSISQTKKIDYAFKNQVRSNRDEYLHMELEKYKNIRVVID